jgi:two-component system nitrogen regulation response regulator NtrX
MDPEAVVIMMSGHGNIETAVKAVKLGAYDFIEKPPSLERLLLLLSNAVQVTLLKRENQALRSRRSKTRSLIGKSPFIAQVTDLIRRVAKTSGSVLVTGENGTGKELVAQQIHALSPRFQKPFIEVNCAAIPEELIESELFGHERGAFTGATQLRRGKFDLANGGTLFLDEIGDMSMKTQAKILRILQEQKFERVGGSQTLNVDVRIVAATNKDLKAEIAKGFFREDLFYRLNVVPIHLIPLRERSEDIAALVEHFLRDASLAHGRPNRSFSPDALKGLATLPWPGNIRELKNLVERLVILSPEDKELGPINVQELSEHLPMMDLTDSEEDTLGEGRKLKDARTEFERDFILKVLKENAGNVSKAAQALGVERSHLHKKMKVLGIEIP